LKHVLAPANREVLAQFAWSNVLLGFDFDGTLAPIVSEPDRAALPPSTRRLLRSVANYYPCIVISGRSRSDVAKRLRGVGVHEIIGNHGIEPWHGTLRYRREVDRWRPLLERRLAAWRGIAIEDKRLSLALHYRHCRKRRQARAAILRAVQALGDIRVIHGKLVVNVLPRDAPHKGIALENALDRLRCDTAIYVGDDETDEDVFAMEDSGRFLGVHVGSKRASLASYRLRGQSEVNRLLRALIDLRRRCGRRDPGP
jgi:trehalose 6-phosphate phosphatase